jgi:hypothetical protein
MEINRKKDYGKKSNRGGARPGSGRKPKGGDEGKLHIGFRCSKDVYNILQLVPNKTKYIEDAVREKHRREQFR